MDNASFRCLLTMLVLLWVPQPGGAQGKWGAPKIRVLQSTDPIPHRPAPEGWRQSQSDLWQDLPPAPEERGIPQLSEFQQNQKNEGAGNEGGKIVGSERSCKKMRSSCFFGGGFWGGFVGFFFLICWGFASRLSTAIAPRLLGCTRVPWQPQQGLREFGGRAAGKWGAGRLRLQV